MPIAPRAKLASLAVAVLVTAIVGAPAFAIDGSGHDGGAIHEYAKPTNKPRPSHPHATPVPTPTPAPTPTPTPVPTPKPTPRPNSTTAPQSTPRETQRNGRDDSTPKPTRKPGKGADASDEVPLASPSDPAGLTPPGAGGIGPTRTRGPSPELLGLAATLAGLVGVGTLWLLTRRRRRRPATSPGTVAARVQAVPPLAERWTNVRLDDNDALPDWLRALGEPERAPLARHAPSPEGPTGTRAAGSVAPMADHALPGDREVPADATQGGSAAPMPSRAPQRFSEPLAAGAMRLVIGAPWSDLLDQPSEQIGVVLATLVAGDEVEIQDLEEPWVRVLTSLGSTGWIRSASLGL